MILSVPFVQTSLGKLATERLNKDFSTNISIAKVDFSYLGSVRLKGIRIKDHHLDTLIYVNRLSTSLNNAKQILDNKFNLGDISLDGVDFYMKTYKGEQEDNMGVFLSSFDDGKPRDSLQNPFLLKSNNIYINDLHYRVTDANKKDSINYEVFKAGGNLQDLRIEGPKFSTKIRGLYFKDRFDLQISNLTTDFSYTLNSMHFKNTILKTKDTDLRADILFSYNREDLADFNSKVLINANFNASKIATNDIRKFYNELSPNYILDFKGNLEGTLNNFELKNLNLSSNSGIYINGDFGFVNSINTQNGFVFDGDINKLSATQPKLLRILPNVLGKNVPSEFAKLGLFNLSGKIKVTPQQLQAALEIESEIGYAASDLLFSNIDDIDYAEYIGEITLNDFNMGVFFNDPLFGPVTLKGDVVGKGFKLENINTTFIGKINRFHFKSYDYENIVANGQYQNNKFDGDLRVDDRNFTMKFNGLADLSSEVNKFDFSSTIENLNLKETNLFTRDSIAILSGEIKLDIEGNTLDDIVGNASFKNVFYTNEKNEYSFDKFDVTSSLKDSIKTVKVSSKDIANGSLSGKFTFSELPKVAQNALGSIYTNYQPYQVTPNQYIDFNFTIFNQIVNVFFPQISIDDNTKLRGRIRSTNNQFRLNFSSPNIIAYGNQAKDLVLRTDNQNPLYNTHLTAEELNTEYYKVSKLNLLNRTQNDTLFFKSEFKGGQTQNEKYNLDFFYTINEESKSVLGFENSTFIFKNNVWNINPDKENTDKVTFKLADNDFDFSKFRLVSGEQKIEFQGRLKGTSEKSFLVDFTKVKLESFMPEIDSLQLKGMVSGKLDFEQKNNNYKPEAALVINDFEINNFKQGDMEINIEGQNSLENYAVDFSIKNELVKSIEAQGFIDFSKNRPLIDLEVSLEDYRLEAFSPLGQDVVSRLRGSVTGAFNLKGFLRNPDMEGSLTLREAGLKFPYLNIDYDFKGESTISLLQQSFLLEDIALEDIKYKSSGTLSGNITHRNFEQWFLDLQINTDNLLVLDTKNSEEALYFGTAFMDGSASITGLTDQLDINVNAKTNDNTTFVVPLKDIETVDNYQLIHFKSDELNINDRQEQIAKEAIKGLSLYIDLEVTDDAKAQVVIDEDNGSQLSGRGNGNLRIEIDTRGTFNMFGDYAIKQGVYDFKYGGIINKPFIIQKGGTISWNGDPYKANLDVTAVYKAKANPGVLLENYNSNRREEIDLVTRITGDLFNSKQDLDIQLTNVDPTIASELEFVLNDNNVNEKTTQFISLLAFNSFRNPDNTNLGNNTISNTASSAIAAAFSNLLNTADSKFQVGLDYQAGDTGNVDRLNLDNQVDVSVSTQVSDRIIINGKVGVPVGAQTQSSVVGEVKVEVLLNEQGSFRGVIFNRQNEIQYSQQEEGYTQGVGLSYQVNFNTLRELLDKIGVTNKEKNIKKKRKDSLTLSRHKDLINFKSSN